MKNFITRRLPDFVLLLYVIAVTAGAFMGGLWASIGLGLGVFLFFFVWHLDQKPPAPEISLATLALAALFVMAGLNFNSSQPDLSWELWIRLATIFLPLCFLLSPIIVSRCDHPKFFTVMPAAMVAGGLGLAMLLYVKAGTAPSKETLLALARYNRGFSYLAVLSFPVVAGLWFSKNRWLIIPFLLLLLIPAELTESRASKLALILALPVIVMAAYAPVFTRRALAMTPFMTIGWPFAAQWLFLAHHDWLLRLPSSWLSRVEIWDYMSYRIMERPLLGWSLGTSGTLPFSEPHGALYLITVMSAAHPHNVMTQLWAELGLPGLAFGLIFALLTLRKASRLDPRLVPFAMGAWVAGFCLCLIAYSFWTDSLFAAFALTGFAFMLLEQKLKPSRSLADAPKAR